MVMSPEPLFAAFEASAAPRPLFLLSAAGRRFDQATARELARGAGFSLLCGRYEGVDQRVADHLCDGELSVGDYVLAGGEAAALVVIDAVARLVPGVMGNEESGADESFADRPARVPAVHPAGASSAATRCPRCSAPATTPGSPAGGGRRRCAARSSGGPISSPAVRSPPRKPALLDEFGDDGGSGSRRSLG